MAAIVQQLGDELADVTPDLPSANSAYQLLLHCCGMLEWWTRSAILGVEVTRDRDGEFTAEGPVASVLDRVESVKEQLRDDLASIDLDAPLRGDPSADYVGTPIGESARGALMHVLEELAQHHGHLEITRDLVLSTR